MDFISLVPCHKDAPIELTHNLDHHLQLSLLHNAQKTRLDAFNAKALRHIVGVRRYDYVMNASIIARTGQPPVTIIIRKLRLGVFGHVCRLQPDIRHSGLHPTSIMAPPLGWPNYQKHQLSLGDGVLASQDRPSWGLLVRDVPCPATQTT